jgi:ComF family protein
MQKFRGHVGRRLIQPALSCFSSFIDLIYPPFCLICKNRLDSDSRFVCNACWSFHVLEHPDLPLEQLDVLQHTTAWFERSIAIYEFSETIQDLIHVMKYKNLPGICTRFGEDIGGLCLHYNFLDDVDIIAPVPLHALRLRERSYNQAGLIAQEIAQLNAITFDEKLLRRVRYTNQQAKFNKEERAENVRDAFALKKNVNIAAKTIALVDDVLTTGATMNECARILKENGANHVITITIVRI